jgi:hypothetical protein
MGANSLSRARTGDGDHLFQLKTSSDSQLMIGANGLFASATGLLATGPPTAYADPYGQVGL